MEKIIKIYILLVFLLAPYTAFSSQNIDLAESYFNEGNIKQAIKYYYKELDTNSSSVEALVGIARCHLREGYDEMAQDAIDRALQINDNDVSVLHMQARLQIYKKEYTSAKATLQSLLSLDSEYIVAYSLLSSALYNLGDTQGADEAFEMWKIKQAAKQ